MEQWSILSNVLNYVQHSRFHSMKHTLDIKVINKYPVQKKENSKSKTLIQHYKHYRKNAWTYMRESNQK